MSSMLEQAIVDAKSLKEAALKNAETIVIEKYSDELVKAESKDNGKPETLAAHVDIPRAPANIRFFAGAILHDSSEMHEMDGIARAYSRQEAGAASSCSPKVIRVGTSIDERAAVPS